MMLFRILFGIDAVVALIFLYFFTLGLHDGSVSSFNIRLWLATLAGLAVILVAGWMLNARGNRRTAQAVLLVLAVPAVLFALFMLSVIIMHPRWN